MAITKTPFRMSFFGGGTDMEWYFREHGGEVLSTTFDKYCYVSVRHLPPFFDYSSEIVYSRIERVKDVSEIEHPLVRNTMQLLGENDLRITYDADLPARSGLGSSSSFAVGLVHAILAMNRKRAAKRTLSELAIKIERELCNEEGGWQDQIAAAYGGLNHIEFDRAGFHVSPVRITEEKKEELDQNLLLYFTGFTRFSSEIQKANKAGSVQDRILTLEKFRPLTMRASSILENNALSLDEFGILLGEEWELKKQTGKSVTSDKIDHLYKTGIDAGALGGKLLGAGGGGFLLLYVPKDRQEAVREAMSHLLEVPFHFEEKGSILLP